jgi:CRISPR system Cascade subunit CasE
VPLHALAPVLVPADANARLAVAHRLMWALFPGSREQTRDFLWREELPGAGPGRGATYYLLSVRPPVDAHNLFEIDPPKPFAPRLAAGDRLGFVLRANPVVSRRTPGSRKSGKHHDVVMDRLHRLPLPKGERGPERQAAIEDAGRSWLSDQGGGHGFRLLQDEPLRVDGYDQVRVPRENGRKPVQFSVLDLEGRLVVTEPERFVAALSGGLGKARAFGCGLMLVRRLPVAGP